jgi:hypothetical protein
MRYLATRPFASSILRGTTACRLPLILVGVLVAGVMVGCGSGAAAGAPTSTPATTASAIPAPTPMPTADINIVASGYSAAWNTFEFTDYNIDVKKQNKWGLHTQQIKDAINHEVVDGQNFDTAIAALDTSGLPAIAADIAAELAADASLENAEGTLALNTDSVINYNAVFSIMETAQGAFTAADATTSRALGDSG